MMNISQMQARLGTILKIQEGPEEINETELEERRRHRELLAHLEKCEVPLRVRECLLRREEKATLEAVRRFIESDKSLLVLSGAAGVGKTVAACSLFLSAKEIVPTRDGDGGYYNRIVWRSSRSLFVRASQLARLSSFDADDKAKFEDAASVEWLVLDDIGAENRTDYWRCLFDELIDRRYSENCKTVITTNLTDAKFKEAYGERIASRIDEAGMRWVCGGRENSLR